ncbi:hypothetical protein PROFUN_14341 [Planoprotostelium fungivorum]|uniref:Uncharacterized protein n=1 Tax=Planoprotostelium fungivorum TaxID=1890364 RepID=A0A2P6N0I7_9EUKA|nr:hypothetical protein PROFUN_14341 [Planoprotostelium fungivorum]
MTKLVWFNLVNSERSQEIVSWGDIVMGYTAPGAVSLMNIPGCEVSNHDSKPLGTKYRRILVVLCSCGRALMRDW